MPFCTLVDRRLQFKGRGAWPPYRDTSISPHLHASISPRLGSGSVSQVNPLLTRGPSPPDCSPRLPAGPSLRRCPRSPSRRVPGRWLLSSD
eukprot:scaffold7381_cov310-Pinguiococcus_pyrenoidosus.AAC.67